MSSCPTGVVFRISSVTRSTDTVAVAHELTVARGDLALAGTLWVPKGGRPSATVYMHPGSGPSDRDNGVFFPPIREHLLAAGFAVCSFDKRGIGGSSGRWEDAGILEQADDALAAVDALVAMEDVRGRLGLYGHSQGAWVVLEAASRGAAPVSFVVTSSGPGVTPAEQERYSALTYLQRKGLSPDAIEQGMRGFDLIVELLREGVAFDEARLRIAEDGPGSVYEELDLPFVPEDEAVWNFAAGILDYESRVALRRIRIPLLGVFGGDDPIVPVEQSVAAFREAVRPELLSVAVFPGADHRLHVDGRLADSYLNVLTSFVSSVVA
jgi:uncharacterized protein